MFWKRGPVCLVLLFAFLDVSVAVELNRTIDDTLGDSVTGKRPSFLPFSGVWENAACKDCVLKPDGILAFKGTWSAATYDPSLNSISIELAFKGTAIYIFFILANIVEQGLPTDTACNFTLDGRSAGNFTHTAASSNEFLYNSLVFSQSDLSNVNHQLIISTSGLDRRVWVNFDYAIYTADDTPSAQSTSAFSSSTSSTSTPQSSTRSPVPSTPSTPSPPVKDSDGPSHVGAIVGGIMGGFSFFFVVLLLFLFFRRRRQKAEQSDDEFPEEVPPTSAGYQYNDLNARFITPFINPSWCRPGPDDGTLAPHPTMPHDSSLMTTHDSLTMTRKPYSDRTLVPTFMPASTNDLAVASIGTSEGPTSSYIPPVPLRESQRSLSDQITEVSRNARQSGTERRPRVATWEMRESTSSFDVVTTRRQMSVIEEDHSREVEMSDMREQIRVMKEQIRHLQTQQSIPLARGSSNRSPPDYSTRQHSFRR